MYVVCLILCPTLAYHPEHLLENVFKYNYYSYLLRTDSSLQSTNSRDMRYIMCRNDKLILKIYLNTLFSTMM